MEEFVLGYDAREMWYDDSALSALIKADKKPLTIDPSIWGSVFDTGDCDVYGADREKCGLGILEYPTGWIGPNIPFWDNLSDLEDCLSKNTNILKKLYWIVAATIVHEDVEKFLENRTDWPFYSNVSPNNIQNDWQFIGYDVIAWDAENITTACAEPEEKEFLKIKANDFFLFSELSVAKDFKSIIKITSPSSLPCLICGIWRI